MSLLGAAALALPRRALAQQPDRMRSIGVLLRVAKGDPDAESDLQARTAAIWALRAPWKRSWPMLSMRPGWRIGAALPPIDAEPVPKIVYRLPALRPDRPTGSKEMLDAHGARARLAGRRAGAWIISSFTGWKWAVFPDGEVHWVPSNVELPVSPRAQARNDVQ